MTIAVEQNPFEIDHWQHMLELIHSQNDLLSRKSLEVIIRGLEELSSEVGPDHSSFCSLGQVLTKLARGYNNPKLFKEAGKAYLQDLRMPQVALDHLDRAYSLGYRSADLKPLQDAAANLIQSFGHMKAPGIEHPRHSAKIVSEMIRRSGRLAIMRHGTVDAMPSLPSVPIQVEHLQAPVDPSACLDQAWEAISSEDWAVAKRLLANLSVGSVGPDALWEAWTEFGEGCYRVGRYDDAEVGYKAACDIYPDLLVSQFNLGVGLQMNQKLDQAIEAYMNADSISPNHPKVWCNLGSTFFLMDDYARSEAALRTAVVIKPDYARAWDNLGAALGAQDRLQDAAMACSRALALKPDYAEASFKLGIIYYSQGRFSESLQHLAQAASLPGLTVYTNAYLAMTLAGLGNLVGAEHALKMACAAAHDTMPETLSMAWAAIGRSRMERLEFTQSKEALENACKLNPDDSQNWMDLGLVHQFAQDVDQANECFKRAMELDSLVTA